nr:unnamed protein product [Digitaria exilis]
MGPATVALRAVMLVLVLVAAASAGASVLVVNKTIESDDGDVIGCVDIYEQPAFKHVPPRSRKKKNVSLLC